MFAVSYKGTVLLYYKLLASIIAETANNSALTLVLALSYGAREEITAAARSLAADAAAGKIQAADIDTQLFASRLNTADMPDPDLLVRTSGEMRQENGKMGSVCKN
jgi:undecaprenyl diphosphate synthase